MTSIFKTFKSSFALTCDLSESSFVPKVPSNTSGLTASWLHPPCWYNLHSSATWVQTLLEAPVNSVGERANGGRGEFTRVERWLASLSHISTRFSTLAEPSSLEVIALGSYQETGAGQVMSVLRKRCRVKKLTFPLKSALVSEFHINMTGIRVPASGATWCHLVFLSHFSTCFLFSYLSISIFIFLFF